MWRQTLALVCFIAALANTASAQECGGTIQDEGIFTTPDPFDEHNKKEERMECVWNIEAPENKRVVLKISKYAIGKEDSCNGSSGDFIAIYDGSTTDEDKRLALLCTKGQDFVIPASGNTLTVKFKTERFNEMTGFVSQLVFTFLESEGCGGNVNLNSDTLYGLQTPAVRKYEDGDVYECVWNFEAPEDYAIKVSFSAFDKFPCKLNHVVEIRDGVVPDSLLLGTFCGKNIPPVTVSSSNRLSVRFSSMQNSQFRAIVSVQRATCSPNLNNVYEESRQYNSPGYYSGFLGRGINCGYEFQSSGAFLPIRLTIKNLDIQPGSQPGKCDMDKLIIGTRNSGKALGQDYISNYDSFNYLKPSSKLASIYDGNVYLARQFELCGKKSVEFIFPSTFFLNLITTPGSMSKGYKGFEIEVSYVTFCGRNYTEPYGRIISGPGGSVDDCYTLISAPEGYTVSLYFNSFEPAVAPNIAYLEVYDGQSTDSPKIMSTQTSAIHIDNIIPPIYSTSNNILLRNKCTRYSQTGIDLTYMTTNQGRGCGGNYFGDQGVVSSPLYPEASEGRTSCQWELETPASTLLHMTFDDFDLSGDCRYNYVELYDRSGKKLAKFCPGKPPSAFKSIDNYVKIVSMIAPNSGGKGWHAIFRAGECLRCRHQTMKQMAVSRFG